MGSQSPPCSEFSDVAYYGAPALESARPRDNPDIRVLFIFISGYTAERIGSKGVVRNGVELLEKPFTPRALVRRARDILRQVVTGPPWNPWTGERLWNA